MGCLWIKTSLPSGAYPLSFGNRSFVSGKFIGLDDALKILPTKLHNGYGGHIRIFASAKKLRRGRKERKDVTLQTNKGSLDENERVADRSPLEDDYIQDNNKVSSFDNSAALNSITIPSRSTVLQACTVTSGLIAALGIIIRQVLTSLQPMDYLVVAFLPGFSEELLFRGALLPLFGINWKSALVVAAIFGFLHLGNGRKYSFAIWATFVGFVYGYATILSSSIVVPMASHAVNNLVGGVLWRYSSNSSK